MAVAFDAASESHTGTTGSASETSFSWTHTPSGTPAGVLVFTFINGNADHALAVKYGSQWMEPVSGGLAAMASGETGQCKTWFLGFNVPTGAQTVTVLRTSNTLVMYAVAITVTAAKPTYIPSGSIVLVQNVSTTCAEQNCDDGSTGVDSLRFAANASGLNGLITSGSPGANELAPGTNSTHAHSIDTGTRVHMVVYETTAGQGSRPVGFASITSDEIASVHLAVREVIAANPRITQDVRLVPTEGDAQVRVSQVVRVAAVNRTPANIRISQDVRLAVIEQLSATRLYIRRQIAGYSPPSFRNGFTLPTLSLQAGASVYNTLSLSSSKGNDGQHITNVVENESGTQVMLFARGISLPLSGSGTISGTLNLCARVYQYYGDQDSQWRIYAYVTQGNSDTPRGTLLDYTAGSGAQTWGTTLTARSLPSAQSLTSVDYEENDRIVIEFGTKSWATYSGWNPITYFELGTDSSEQSDLTSGQTTAGAPWVEFSQNLTFNEESTSLRWYFDYPTPGYTPATIRGGWDQTTGIYTQSLESDFESVSTDKVVPYIDITPPSVPYTYAVIRLISGPFSTPIDFAGLARITTAICDIWGRCSLLRFYIYVTSGNSDTPRGTLLAATKVSLPILPPTSLERATCTPYFAINSLSALTGDRLVLEIGYEQNVSGGAQGKLGACGGVRIPQEGDDQAYVNGSFGFIEFLGTELGEAPTTTFPALTVAL